MAETRRAKQGKMTARPKFRVIGDEDLKDPPQLSSAERAYYRQLHRMIDDIFTRASDEYGMTWSKLAEIAGLSYQTVSNLGDRQTKYPRHMTIFKLARAVEMDLELQEPPKQVTKSKKMAIAG